MENQIALASARSMRSIAHHTYRCALRLRRHSDWAEYHDGRFYKLTFSCSLHLAGLDDMFDNVEL